MSKLRLRECLLRKDSYDEHGKTKALQFRDYQVGGTLHLLERERTVLGDDTGLGKTLQTLTALCFLMEEDPTIPAVVLTTKTAVTQWESEVRKFTAIEPFLIAGTPKKREKQRDAFLAFEGPKICIMGHRSLVQDFKACQSWTDFYFVIDECAVLKNEKTQIHQVCHHLQSQAKRTWGITATLLKNNLLEGWAIYRVICPGIFPIRNQFMHEYCVVRKQKTAKGFSVPIVVGYQRTAIPRFRKEIEPYFLGRSKMDVAQDLPPLTIQEVGVVLPSSVWQKYNEALDGLLLLDTTEGTVEKNTSKLTAVGYCQQIVNDLALLEDSVTQPSPKTEVLLDLLTEGDLEGEKVIVFSRFRKMIDLLERYLTEQKVPCVRITGSEDTKQRKVAQDLFQDPDSNVRVCLITTAASEAINLQKAKAIIFYDTPWSAGEYLQILGRMIRLGSEHTNVFAKHLVVEGSIDERVMTVLHSKMELLQQVIGKRLPDDALPTSSSVTDLYNLLLEDKKKCQPPHNTPLVYNAVEAGTSKP